MALRRCSAGQTLFLHEAGIPISFDKLHRAGAEAAQGKPVKYLR